MKRILLLALLASLHLVVNGQNNVSPNELAHLNNSHLRKLQHLLLQWQKDVFVWDQMTGEQWQIKKIYVDEKDRAIIHKIRPWDAKDTSDTWTVTYKIPLQKISTLGQDTEKQCVIIGTSGYDIAVYEADYPQPAGREKKINIYCNLMLVRNLAGQISETIKAYQSSVK